VKTNLLFFTKGRSTERVWYYDLSGVKVGKKNPLTLTHFEDFFRLLPGRTDSERSWTVARKAIDEKSYDLKAVNPHARNNEDLRTPEELLDLIDAKGKEVAEAIVTLRGLTTSRGE
jgi:type I restriction enzyme M protein